jgi:hypothetical protein
MTAIDLSQFNKDLKKIEKNLKFATALALTRTAQKVRLAEQDEIKTQYDRPKPFTVNSIYFTPAKKDQTEIYSVVGIKDRTKGNPPVKYLQATMFGKSRRLKGFEKKLQQSGLMPSGHRAVPGQGLRLNKFGNMTQGQIKKAATANEPGSKFFSGRVGRKQTYGIWQRYGARSRKIKPFIIFIKRTSYNKLYDFYKVAVDKSKAIISREFKDAARIALK